MTQARARAARSHPALSGISRAHFGELLEIHAPRWQAAWESALHERVAEPADALLDALEHEPMRGTAERGFTLRVLGSSLALGRHGTTGPATYVTHRVWEERSTPSRRSV